jgi:hypothetical protein
VCVCTLLPEFSMSTLIECKKHGENIYCYIFCIDYLFVLDVIGLALKRSKMCMLDEPNEVTNK